MPLQSSQARKIALEFQSLLLMTALMIRVTNAWPVLTFAGGCSLSWTLGTIHDTCGRAPALACALKLVSGWVLPVCPSWCTALDPGRTLQICGAPSGLLLLSGPWSRE